MTSQASSLPSAQWDVFLSYGRMERRRAGVLTAALQARGLRVFVDDAAVEDFSSITATITRALARSKVLLALYSADYPGRRACQWELTYAFLAGQREGDPLRRVLVINPEVGTDHVHPVELRDARHWPWPSVPGDMEKLTARVAAHVTQLTKPLGNATAPQPAVAWLPAPARTGSPRFTGRLPEQWRIHSALHGHRAPLVQAGSSRIAQIRGMPGIGKSVLAQEYALRFSPAFPGGVFWFDLHGARPGTDKDAMTLYIDQVATVCAALSQDTAGVPLARLLSRLAVVLGERGEPCLWVVDGVPDGLTVNELHLLRGPNLLAATLLTTRSMRYTSLAEPIDLTPLPDQDAVRLLTSVRTPRNDADRAAAVALVHDVGGHPQALDMLADLASNSAFPRLRGQLHQPDTDLLNTATSWGATGRSTRLTADLLLQPLSSDGPSDDVLRLLALACPAPLPQPVIETVLATVAPYDPWAITSSVTNAVDTLLGAGALVSDSAQERSWTLHPLVARAVRRYDTDSVRQEELRRVLLQALAVTPAHPVSMAGLASSGQLEPHRPVRPPTAGQGERTAAFNLQVELITRVGYQQLPPGQGSLRDALTSLHSLFAFTRTMLHRMALDDTPSPTFPRIATTLLNEHLRPFLTTWHPALKEHEAARPPHLSAVEHEQQWDRAAELRAELSALHQPLAVVVGKLAALCGTDLTTPSEPLS